MRMPVRRALIAITVTTLVLPSAASASCLPVCTEAVRAAVETALCPPICLDDVWARMEALLAEEGDDGGVLCAYGKLDDPPPSGWSGGGGPPYVWIQTKAWGAENPDEHDLQLCVFPCSMVPFLTATPEPDLSDPVNVTVVNEAAACAVPLLR